jgi:hypothetical protein
VGRNIVVACWHSTVRNVNKNEYFIECDLSHVNPWVGTINPEVFLVQVSLCSSSILTYGRLFPSNSQVPLSAAPRTICFLLFPNCF